MAADPRTPPPCASYPQRKCLRAHPVLAQLPAGTLVSVSRCPAGTLAQQATEGTTRVSHSSGHEGCVRELHRTVSPPGSFKPFRFSTKYRCCGTFRLVPTSTTRRVVQPWAKECPLGQATMEKRPRGLPNPPMGLHIVQIKTLCTWRDNCGQSSD